MLIKQSGSPRRQVTKHTPARPSSSPNMLGPAANWLAAGLLMTFVVPRFASTIKHHARCASRSIAWTGAGAAGSTGRHAIGVWTARCSTF
jgi:hypothetical protein